MTKKAVVSQLRQHEKYERLVAATANLQPLATAVAHPCDESSLRGALEAAEAGMISPILVGPEEKICERRKVARSRHRGHRHRRRRAQPGGGGESRRARSLGQSRAADERKPPFRRVLGAVAKRETGLRTARRISHVFVMDVPTHPQTLFITDAAVNIAPDLLAKRDIVQNAIDLYVGLGLGTPKVAILSAVETVNPGIPSTIDAAALCKMADRGQITGGELDGPLAFDNAISPEAARIKGIKSPVAGQAQILVVPNLEAGNMLAKNLSFLSRADAAGIVLGARVPIILTSRADNVRTPHGILRRGYAPCIQPNGERADPGLSHDRNHPRAQRRQLEHQISAVRRCRSRPARAAHARARSRASARVPDWWRKRPKGETLVDETWPAREVSHVPVGARQGHCVLARADRRKAADRDRPSRRPRRTGLQRADPRQRCRHRPARALRSARAPPPAQ